MMKTANVLIVVCLMLGAVLSAAEPKSEAVEKLGLKESSVEGATIYYEPCLEEKLDVLKKAYSDYRQRMAEHEKPQISADPEPVSKKIAIVNDICKIVGDDEMKAKLITVADGFINSGSTISMPLTGSDNIIYLMLQSTTKDYLRSGGKLPNLSYDKEADTAEYKFFFGSDTDNASNQELLLPVKSADEVESVINAIFTVLPKQIGKMPDVKSFIVIHEIAEAAIVGRMKSMDPYKRWFTDGFANATTYEIIRRHYSQQDADTSLKDYSTEPYQEIKNQIDLQYWMSAQFTFVNKWPIKKEKDHTYARYCFATEEAQRIVNEYGVECIKKILDVYVANGDKKPGSALTAIQQATGDDIQKHLMQYQTFKTKKEGLVRYQKDANTAMAGNDFELAAFSMLRMLDLMGEQPLEKESLQLRQSIAMTLIRGGYPEEATKSITEFADWMCESKHPNNHYVGRHLVILYAMQIRQPQVALEYARKMLEDKPEDVYALTIMMIMARVEKDLQKARKIAEQICKLQPDEEDPCHDIAKQILAEQDK